VASRVGDGGQQRQGITGLGHHATLCSVGVV